MPILNNSLVALGAAALLKGNFVQLFWNKNRMTNTVYTWLLIFAAMLLVGCSDNESQLFEDTTQKVDQASRLINANKTLDKSSVSDNLVSEEALSNITSSESEVFLSMVEKLVLAQHDIEKIETDHLNRAIRALNSAVNDAKESGVNEFKAAPLIMLGNVALSQARYYHDELRLHRTGIQCSLSMISVNANQVTFEKEYAASLPAVYPHEDAVDKLIATIEEGGRSLENQLAKAKQKVTYFKKRTEQFQKHYDGYLAEAKEGNLEYLKLLDAAKKVTGDAHYKLLRKAYKIKSSSLVTNALENNADEETGPHGLIYYEKQTEIFKSKLKVASIDLKLYQQQVVRLTEIIDQLDHDIAAIDASPIKGLIGKTIASGNVRIQEIEMILNEVFLTINTELNRYLEIQAKTVDLYTKAIKYYKQAGSASREINKHTRTMIDSLDCALVNKDIVSPEDGQIPEHGLWQEEVAFFELLVGGLNHLSSNTGYTSSSMTASENQFNESLMTAQAEVDKVMVKKAPDTL